MSRGKYAAAIFAMTMGISAALVALLCCGCGSGLTGGSLPPGEPDIEGYVLAAPQTSALAAFAAAACDSAVADPAQGWPPVGTPVPDCDVYLRRLGNLVGSTRTDRDGRFEFDGVPTGDYELSVTPPQGSGYAPQTVRFRHRYGQQTRLVIYLQPEATE